jgi:hypothetical protein
MIFKEDIQIDLIREKQQELQRLEKEYARHRLQIALQRQEEERTIPPLDDMDVRTGRRKYENLAVSRGALSNEKREYQRSMMLLMLLMAATASLVWWGITLMLAA